MKKNRQRLTEEELAQEALRWDNREVTPRNWEDTPEAIPRLQASVAISLRIPKEMLLLLKEFARREGLGYQVLLKKWLDERIRQERERLTPKPLLSPPSAKNKQAALLHPSPTQVESVHKTEKIVR